jgi:hypothetical protein
MAVLTAPADRITPGGKRMAAEGTRTICKSTRKGGLWEGFGGKKAKTNAEDAKGADVSQRKADG